MTLGRKPEASLSKLQAGPSASRSRRSRWWTAGRGRGPAGAGVAGDNFNRPTDVAWDAAGNIFVADGFGNSRIAKFDKDGKFIKSWGSAARKRASSIRRFDRHGCAGQCLRGRPRQQTHPGFSNDGTFKTQITNVGAPWAICISPGAHQYLYSSNSNATNSMDNGEIYKMELDGKVLGKFGNAGKLAKEFGTVNEIDCRNPNELYVGELTNWRVQKLTLHSPR